MANVHEYPEARHPTTTTTTTERTTKEVAAGSSVVEAVAGAGVVVLAILGLIGFAPATFAAICLIGAGGALLMESGALATRARRMSAAPTRELPAGVTGGISSEMVAAAGAVTLGILALIGLYPNILVPIGLLVLGAGILFGSAATSRVGSASVAVYEPRYAREAPPPSASETTHTLVRQSVFASSGAHVLVGLGAIVLGILALLGFVPLTLTLIAELALGAMMLMSGAVLGARTVTAYA